jgi:hypothetical protein
VAPGLLQQLLLRAPRNNLSPGIVKDLMAALQQLEQVGCRFVCVCVRGGGGCCVSAGVEAKSMCTAAVGQCMFRWGVGSGVRA